LRRYVVVGNSAAGVSAIRSIRAYDGSGPITLVSEEPHPFYSRVLLTHYVAGRVPRERLFLVGEGFYRVHGVEVLLGVRAVGLDVYGRRLELSDGRVIPYDVLLVATGARPVLARPFSPAREGVMGLRFLGDAERLRRATAAGARVAVVGGGPAGIKLACALREAGGNPTLLVSSPHILSQVADDEAALLLESRLAAHGLRVRCGVEVREVAGGPHGVEGLVLSDGTCVACDLVVVCKGVEPRAELLAGKAEVRRGVVVDDRMRTSLPEVYAAGDVVECTDVAWGQGRVGAIWPHAVAQGKVAGANMAGVHLLFRGALARNSLDVFGLPFVSMGVTRVPPEPGWGSQVLRDGDAYLKLVFRGGRIVGAVLVGCAGLAGVIQAAIRRGDGAWQQRIAIAGIPAERAREVCQGGIPGAEGSGG